MNNRFLVLLVIYLIIYLLSVLYKNKQIFCAILLSLLSWERGLKSLHKVWKSDNAVVAPLVGAWIEILNGKIYYRENSVAPLVGAWIEINVSSNIIKPLESLLSWERGLKSSYIRNINIRNCRSSRGSVDWNSAGVSFGSSKYCRSSRGSVDWNIKLILIANFNKVAPLVGAWIEIKSEIYKVLYVSSLLSWERGLKFFSCSHCSGVMCRSSRGSVYWNQCHLKGVVPGEVAPLVGACIEISVTSKV